MASALMLELRLAGAALLQAREELRQSRLEGEAVAQRATEQSLQLEQRGEEAAALHAKLAEKNGKKTYVDSVINGGTPPKPPPPKPRKPPQDATKQVQIDVHKDDPSMGPKNAPIVLATFSDFQ